MNVLTCYDCDGLFNYGYENRLQMAYKGVENLPSFVAGFINGGKK